MSAFEDKDLELFNLAKIFYSETHFKKALTALEQIKKPTNDVIRLKADTLFELGDFKQSIIFFRQLGLVSHEAFCYLMLDDLKTAEKLYFKLEYCAPKKWGLFLCQLFSSPNKHLIGPGFLTFRLFFESSYGYFYRFAKSDYCKIINKHKAILSQMYPELENNIRKAVEKADSIIAKNQSY